YRAARHYAAPRRLAVRVEQLATQQPDRTQQMDGPPLQAAFGADGQPTPAALGFARMCGVALSELDQSGPRLRFVHAMPGQLANAARPGGGAPPRADLLSPQRRRLRAGMAEFVRPTRWLVMLLGEDLIPCRILSRAAGRESRGHRFHHSGAVRISSPACYAD